jgi:retron-type reverse transcriptase
VGIPAYEDRILRRAVQPALEPIYEQEFYDFSNGFRPGKSARQALNRLWKESMNIERGYSIDLDISKYADRRFDNSIPHDKLREVLGQGVSDGVIAD